MAWRIWIKVEDEDAGPVDPAIWWHVEGVHFDEPLEADDFVKGTVVPALKTAGLSAERLDSDFDQ